MAMLLFDIETELIPPEGHQGIQTIWCIVAKEVGGEPKVFAELYAYRGWSGYLKDFVPLARQADYLIAHNGLAFDVPVVNRLLDAEINEQKVIDTFVVSRLVNYTRFKGHGLEEIGETLGVPKSKFNDFSQLSQEMIDYCVQDVEVTEAVYKMYEKYIWADDWQQALRIEHDMVLINEDMSTNGFKFNKDRAEELLASVKLKMQKLETIFQDVWPPWLEEVNRVLYRVKLDGSLFKTTQDALDRYPNTKLEGGELVCYDYRSFNPGSTKDRIEKLWEAGWEPYDKSKTHIKFARVNVGDMWGKKRLTPELFKEKKEYFDYYGWTVSEENLSTLPDSAPEGASMLAEWLTLEGRRSSLEEWLGCVREDGRIHGKFWHIGAWTHRMSHSNPNQANISSPFTREPRNAVEEVKKEYDASLRALWCVEDGVYLVGTDADGIQLRILAHYLKNDAYVHAIVSGRKEDQTDIHNLNLRALGLNNLERDDAKTFIYAWLLGAGTGKVASILRCNQPTARTAVKSFLANTEGLTELKRGRIVRDARRGFFEGVDGRKVLCNSEHLMLAGYLQNAESCIMKYANRLWREEATQEKILFKQVDFVHDEWQTECHGSLDMAERLGEIQRNAIEQVGKDLELYCPLAGSTDIGSNWLETH